MSARGACVASVLVASAARVATVAGIAGLAAVTGVATVAGGVGAAQGAMSGGCTQPVGSSHSPAGAAWAAAFTARAYVHPSGDLRYDATTVRDAFARPLAIAGLHLDSAGTGSCAVYDRAHGIAATTQGGDVVGSSIGLAPPPPVPDVPDVDLSHVRSTRGLHLGMSVADLERVYGSAHHVRTSPDGRRTYYYYRRTDAAAADAAPAGPRAASDALAIFTNGKATYLSLVDVGG